MFCLFVFVFITVTVLNKGRVGGVTVTFSSSRKEGHTKIDHAVKGIKHGGL